MPNNRFDLPLFTVISAIIPSAGDPSSILRDRHGNLPSVMHRDGEGTWEETLQKMGRNILGRDVSVAERASYLETEPGHVIYKGKPVQAELPDDSPYQWR